MFQLIFFDETLWLFISEYLFKKFAFYITRLQDKLEKSKFYLSVPSSQDINFPFF